MNKQNSYLFVLLSLIISNIELDACSMFKITQDGKTVVGNNEDYWDPNTRIWFEQGAKEKFGAVYVGFDNMFPQGGMNEKGLVFDGFAMPFLAVSDTAGKKTITQGEEAFNFGKTILQGCSNVNDVKNHLMKFNLQLYQTSLLLFVDKSGDYLIVEGDSLIIGSDSTYIQSNFYPSQTEEKDVKIGFYNKGKRFLQESIPETKLSYCASMMDSLHQDFGYGGTMYTTIYDLENLDINLYYHFNYDEKITFNLIDELKKGNKQYKIPDLFPNNEAGHKHLLIYNSVKEKLGVLNDKNLAADTLKFNDFLDGILKLKPPKSFTWEIHLLGHKWLNEYHNSEVALKILRLNNTLFPNTFYTFNGLGTAYMKNQQYDLAKKQYSKALELNPHNSFAKSQLKELEKLSN